MKCKGCGIEQDHPHYGFLWLSDDGYCSVCNHKYRDRKRDVIGMDNFVTTKKTHTGKNTHLDTTGVRPSRLRSYVAHSNLKAMAAAAKYRAKERKAQKRISDF